MKSNKGKSVGWIYILLYITAMLVILVLGFNFYVTLSTRKFIFTDPQNVPFNKTGVVLGTSKFTKKGNANPFFYKRIAAAEVLYRSGKIKYIVLSGDNRHRSYNEPLMMKRELLRRGIPDSVIYLDYAGLRTYDSVIRAYKIFGQQSFTIISQRFHIERALFIAHHIGINAIAFEADEVDFPDNLPTIIRELFARVKMIWDLVLQPPLKNLDNKIVIP